MLELVEYMRGNRGVKKLTSKAVLQGCTLDCRVDLSGVAGFDAEDRGCSCEVVLSEGILCWVEMSNEVNGRENEPYWR